MTRGKFTPVTIAIPVFATPPALLDACLRSVAEARGEADQAYVVVDGPQTPDLEAVVASAPSLGFEVIRQPERLGLVGNWNACLSLGSHALVHVMHADDAVHPEFYGAVQRAVDMPDVIAAAAGRIPPGATAVLGSRQAAAYLLSHQKPPSGSFVLRRSALGTPAQGFDAHLPYCPDEELFLRVLAWGDLALVDQDLYVESRHDRQARFATWRRPDFADIYYAARIAGARAVGVDVVPMARRQTRRRLLSVGRFLSGAGEGGAARSIVRSIVVHDRWSLLTWRFWALVLLATAARGHVPTSTSCVVVPGTGSRSSP